MAKKHVLIAELEDQRRADDIGIAVERAGDNLVSDGTYQSYENTVYLAGSCNVGKSTLASVFIGHEIPKEWRSTDGLMIYFGQNGIDLLLKRMVPLKEDLNMFSKVLRGKPKVNQKDSNKETNGRQTGYPDYNMIPDDSTLSPSPIVREKTNAEIQCYRLTDEFLKDVRNGKHDIDIAPSDLVDFGGQRSFDMTHQLFIRQNGTFVVMFDGRYGFLKTLPEYHGINTTNEDIVKHWVNSILTYGVKGHGILPMILFAASHSDHFSEIELKLRKDEYLGTLRGYFGNHPMKDHIVLDIIYFINATDPLDDGVQCLQHHLVTIAMSQPTWGKRMPIRWVPLEMQMTAMKKNHEYIVSKETLNKANALNGDLALSDDQFGKFLEYQHSKGTITYINQPGLAEFVVLYPPALVNILRSFITSEMFWPEGKISEILESMYKTGKLSKQDLVSIWSQKWVPINSTNIRNFVIKLLIHLDVLIIPQQYRESDESRNDDIFFVPCIITNKLPMTFFKDEAAFEERTISLVFSMKTPTVPPALAYKLIGAVASIWPLKEENNRALLFQFAAVLSVDSENEMRIIIHGNEIIIYLTNKRSNTRISPDTAASIQECLTNTLEYALRFYHSNMGIDSMNFEGNDFFEIKIGLVCNKQPCVVTVDEAIGTSKWVCSQGHCHLTDVVSKWVFNRRLLDCSTDCKGLSPESLSQPVEDLYFIKIANKLGMKSFREMMAYLTLDTAILEDLEYEYRKPLMIKFMGLKKWQDRRTVPDSEPCLKDLQVALSAIDDNRHLLCQVFRKVSNLENIASMRFQSAPDDKDLRTLAHKMGDCVIHLGIELGLTVSAIEETMYRFPKDMYEQIYDIFRKWKQGSRIKPTIFRLMEAVNRVDKGGLRFLMDIYKIRKDL